MIRKVTLALFFIGSTMASFSQIKNQQSNIKEEKFTVEALEKALLAAINKTRVENKFDSLEVHEVMQKASEVQADYMAKYEKAELEQSKSKYKNTGKRVMAFGGTQNADEVVIAMPITKGKDLLSSSQVADMIMEKWKKGKLEKPIINNGNYVYVGTSARLDGAHKKAYVSMVFGSFNSFNTGADKRKELDVPFTKKKKVKVPVDAKKQCKNCDKFKDMIGLQKGLHVKEDNKIYLRYDNLKAFKKLIKKSKDGLAVDIVQKAQYEKPDYNIVDNNLPTKGVLQKAIYSSKIYKKNLVKPEGKKKVNSIEVCVGKLPAKIDGPYELNLLIIQEGVVCRTITRSYVEEGDQTSSTKLEMLLMPDSVAYLQPKFVPKAETTILNFTIPFEKNKFEYKPEDMKPFLDALQEPDFIVEGLYISAYSSIEGDSISNSKLQRKRAESIVKALSGMSSKNVITDIKTSDSWNMFALEMQGGQYDYLTKLPKKEAIKEINSKKLDKDLEPFLSKQRFAQIVMDITYDIQGAKEEKFSVSQFNKAVKQNNVKQAMKIQYYIEEKIRQKQYAAESASKLEIPKDPKFAGLHMNKIVYRYQRNNNTIGDEDYAELKEIGKLDPKNSYLIFNNLFCEVKLADMGDQKYINETQKKIDGLYGTDVPKKYIDALNIEFQFKVMDAMDTVENSEPIIQACIEKIKSFYNFKEASWQNSLKLAYEFMRFKDFKFAASLLEPFITQPGISEQLVYTYISCCAQIPEKIKSKSFVTAMRKAKELNPERYCKLLGEPYLTFQILDNPLVKADYAKANCK